MIDTPERDNLQVFTLGSFDVRKNDQSLVTASARSYRLWELFKYILTNRDKPVYVESLIDFLWSEKDCADPYNALKTQMYRLRKLLGQGREPYQQYLVFANNCYKWNHEADIWLDAAVFEGFVELGRQAQSRGDLGKGLDYYSLAVSMYKGRYLSDSPFSEWLVSARNHYHRLYVEAVTELCAALHEERRYDELMILCERAFKIEFFEEAWHQYYIEALLYKGKQRLARSHYDSVTAAYQKELGVALSSEMRQISRRLLGDRSDASEKLESITASFRNDDDQKGAFVCEPNSFRKLYELEMRRNERNGQSVFLGMIYLDAGQDSDHNEFVSNPARGILAETIIKGLRRGDIVTEWRPNQYLVLLPGLNFEQAEKVMARLTRRPDLSNLNITCELLPLQIADLLERMDSFNRPLPIDSVPA